MIYLFNKKAFVKQENLGVHYITSFSLGITIPVPYNHVQPLDATNQKNRRCRQARISGPKSDSFGISIMRQLGIRLPFLHEISGCRKSKFLSDI